MFGFVSFVLFACRSEKIVVLEPGEEVVATDNDRDGFDSTVDCDDWSPTVNPNAEEICDAIDNNCNGEVDEGVAKLYYLDSDGDGFGDMNSPLYACTPPSEYIVVGNDCDDSNALIFPGAPEVCDEVDNDCDDEIDEGLLQGLFLDNDGDGYGDGNVPAENCVDNLDQYVSNELDCDDSNSTVFNGAIEICDEIDNDCDGAIDEPGSGNQEWFLDADSDGYGDPTGSTFSCTQPDGYVDNDGDCDDGDAYQNPDALEMCNLEDDDCDQYIDENPIDPTAFYPDLDSDGFGDDVAPIWQCSIPVGYVANHLDCNDSNANVSPQAPEICNGSDDNCNGIDDDYALGAATYYPDIDGDGYGDMNSPTTSCQAIADHVLNGLDCDDNDVAQNPLGIESCNGEDDNCDGNVDENSIDSQIWYLDADGDNFGVISSWRLGCTQPVGYVASNGDCDDADNSKNPNTPEICNGLDDNCNNQIDEGVANSSWYYDNDGDGFGDPWISIPACSQPTGMIADNHDCNDNNPDINPNQDEICGDNADNNCDGLVDDASAIDAYSGYLDLDGDGFGGDTFETSCTDQYLNNNDDCDDGDPAVHPNGFEDCDGIDNDCDGNIDSANLCPCNFETYNGSSYLMCTANRTWSVAKGNCAQWGYHLVTIDDAGEDSWLESTVDSYSQNRWWIGYNDLTVEGYWDWDGPYSTYTNWRNNEPNNANNIEDCAILNQGSNGGWNDVDCEISIYYVCEANEQPILFWYH